MKIRKKFVFLSSLTWSFAGFDFILLPLLAKEIGPAFFPNIDPTQSILAVYGVFSLSLLARVFGGIVFGTIADTNGQRPVITICLLALTVLMFVSAVLPGVHNFHDNILVVPVLFTLARLGTGFFVGALWPTAAIFGMERLGATKKYTGSGATKKNDSSHTTKGDPKKLTVESAFMQTGFHIGVILAVVSIITFIYFHHFPFKDASVWREMCIIGGL